MTDELKHECAVAMVVLRKSAVATGDFGGTKLSLLLENGAERAKKIVEEFEPQFESAKAYLDYIDSLNCTGDRIEYTENGATIDLK